MTITSATRFCGTGANSGLGGGVGWTTPGNITAEDGNYAFADYASSTQNLIASNFGFTTANVPASAILRSITFEIKCVTDAGINAVRAAIQDGSGTTYGIYNAAGPVSTEAYVTIAHTVAEWGVIPDIYSTTFGCSIDTGTTTGTKNIAINAVRAYVTYDLPTAAQGLIIF